MAHSESKIESPPHVPGALDNGTTPAPNEQGKYLTVHDQAESPDAADEGVKIVEEGGSGTKTALHQTNASPNGPDLEDQKTVISRRTEPLPPHLISTKDLGGLLEGEQLGHFRLDEFVGGGGMGAVFRGTDLQLGRTVAVKVLSRDQGADDETLRRFNEAQSAARLDHDNIARVFFVGEHEGWNFIVFEFIEGVNLRDLVEQNGPRSLETAIDYVVQIAEALEHAAARDVVHRDIKPSNVLISPDGHAKLVDMGLARLHHMEAGHSDLTASGVTLGTFDYISPEQASDPRRADVRSDLYSLGCTLYFMLVGRPPFPHGTVLQKLLAHSGESPPDPRDEHPELPPELSKIMLRLLAKRPEQRYQSPHEFIREMLLLRDQLGFGQSKTAFADGHYPGPTWNERLISYSLPAALLLAVLFGLDAYWKHSASNSSLPELNLPVPVNNLQPERGVRPSIPPDDASSSTIPNAQDNGESSELIDGNANPNEPQNTGGTEKLVANSAADADSSTGSHVTSADGATSPDGVGASNVPPIQTGGESEAIDDLPVLRQIVIGNAAEIGDLGDDVRIFSSLPEALASEEFHSNLEHLEAIEFRGERHSVQSPITIDIPADKQLILRGVSVNSAPPEIQFPVRAATSPDGDWGVIEFQGGKLIFENLHLRMIVDSDLPSDHDVALVRLSTDKKKQLELSKCIVTIENPTPELSGTVAVFDIAADDDVSRAEIPAPQRLPFHLRDCVVRGEATVVRMRQSVPVQIVWNNGLLTTSQRLLLADGTPHKVDDTTIRLSLLNVTADVGRGLCLLRDSQKQPNQPGLELVCNKTIVSAGGSNLVEHIGINKYDIYQRSLFLRGDWNVYEDVATFWQVSVDDESKPGLDWPAWNERLRMGGGMPSSVNPIGWVKLRSDVSAVPIHLRGVGDYLLNTEDPGAAATGEDGVSGLQSEMLPDSPNEVEEVDDALPPQTTDATQGELAGMNSAVAEAESSLPRSAYVHVPFCAHRCGYCNFSVIAGRNDLAEEYIDAVAWELTQLSLHQQIQQPPLDTLYFGGGTPTQLTTGQLRRLFNLLTSHLPVSDNSEITVEANPADLGADAIELLIESGVNRISLGAQSFQDAHLRTLERDHTGQQVADVVAQLRRAGIASISIDLIFGVPGQSLAQWQADLGKLLELAPDHVSTYGLTFEKGTSFFQRLERHELQQADESLERDMYLAALDTLTTGGYEHYEVSSFARPGKRSRHNEVYWTGQPYWAFGPSASRFVQGRRETNHRSVTTYLRRIRANESPVAESEALSPEDAARERLVFALRRLEGLQLSEFHAITGFSVESLVGNQFQEFVGLGLLDHAHDRLRLTRAGLLVSDSIWPAFL